MRYAIASAMLLTLFPVSLGAETLPINQSAWLNYAIVVNTVATPSDVALAQHGTINGISSVQIAGENDAELRTHQKGRRNTAVVFQAGWNTMGSVVQQGQNGFSGHTDYPNTYWARDTDNGYLSYFMTGGFSLVTLTDPNHTWFSRFGRAR